MQTIFVNRALSVVARTERELIWAALGDTIHHVPIWAEGMMFAGVNALRGRGPD
jgi:hypothetical protein